MHRLTTLVAALAALGVVLGAVLAHPGSADAQQRRQQAKPPKPPKVILRDRLRNGPPSQPEPRYYGPAPGIQAPMRRVPLPEPLAQPPINR